MATSGTSIRIDRKLPGDGRNSQNENSVTFSCRVAELKVDSNTTTSSHTDPDGKVSTSTSTTYRVSFVASNTKYIRGDEQIFKPLPSEFLVVVTPNEDPLTQWDGRDAEVTGSEYKNGIFDADTIFVPSLNYKLEEPKGGAGGLMFYLIFGLIVAGFFLLFYKAFPW